MTPAIDPARFGARDAQPLENMKEDARSIVEGLFGKTKIGDMPVFAQAMIEQKERICAIAARKFGDAEGEELLEALCDVALRRQVFLTQMGLPSDQVLALGQFREGMGALVYVLLAWMAQARGEQPPQQEGTQHAKSTRQRRTVKRAAKKSAKR